jgi:hypothetical protein
MAKINDFSVISTRQFHESGAIVRGKGFEQSLERRIPSELYTLGRLAAADIDKALALPKSDTNRPITSFGNGLIGGEIVRHAAELAYQQPPLSAEQASDFYAGVLSHIQERYNEDNPAVVHPVEEGVKV